MDYPKIITPEPGKRGAKPCVRCLRETLCNMPDWLASGMALSTYGVKDMVYTGYS